MRPILIFLAAILFVLVVGGALTAQYASNGAQTLPLAKVQTTDPEASVLEAAPWQAQQFILLVAFLLFNLVGIAGTLALIMWFLHRQVTRVRADTGSSPGSEIEPAS